MKSIKVKLDNVNLYNNYMKEKRNYFCDKDTRENLFPHIMGYRYGRKNNIK